MLALRFDFRYLDKKKAKAVLPTVFSILHSNMSVIAPTGNSYAEDERIFLENVAPALEKAPRQIVLFYDGETLFGYFQYYVNGELFMMEEIQLKREYWHCGAFGEFYRWLLPLLPDGIARVEAFAHKKNENSRSILRHLGLRPIDENENHIHFRGEFSALCDHYVKNA